MGNLIVPMPLEEFEDYGEYWRKREKRACTPPDVLISTMYPPIIRAKIISEYIEPDSTILDIGCGEGTLIDYIFKTNLPRRIAGIDISREAIGYTNSRGYEAYKMDITSATFKTFMEQNKFDYIIITEVLEHITEPEKVMLIIRECFNKGIFVSIPNSGYFIHRIRLLSGRFPIVVIMYHVKEHVRFWTHKDFLYWCDHLGFRVVSFRASRSCRKLSIDFGRILPSLFAMQIVYELRKKQV